MSGFVAWVEEKLEDTGKGVADVGESLVEGVKDAGDFIQEEVIDPVKEFGSSFEDAVRDAADDVNKVIENPYVQMIATIIDPTPGKIASTTLRAYAKVNSGDELTASDLAQLGISSVAALGDVPIDPDTAKVIKSAAAVADGGDLQDVLVSNLGEKAFNKIAPELKQTAKTAFGDDVYTLVQENIDPIKAGFRIASGESPTQVLAETYGDQIVGALGSDNPSVNALGYAGLKTAVGLDQGLDADKALLGGAKEYYNRGGQLPDLNVVGGLAGINIPEIDFGDTKFIKDLYAGTIGKLPDFPDMPDLGFIEDYVKQYAPQFKGKLDFKGLNLDIADVLKTDLNLRDFDLSGVDVAFDTPDINLPDFDLPSFDLGLPQPEPREPVQIDPTMIASRQDAQQETPEDQLDIAQLLLADFSLKNPLLRS